MSSINILILLLVNELVTLLAYSLPLTSVLVVPLSEICTFLLLVFTCTDCFIHSVLYFGLIVPLVKFMVVLEFVFSLKFVLLLYIASGAWMTTPELPVYENIPVFVDAMFVKAGPRSKFVMDT